MHGPEHGNVLCMSKLQQHPGDDLKAKKGSDNQES